jgi:phosphoribosylformimino-5-aminoimidazole carboxamide ribotide isomerase
VVDLDAARTGEPVNRDVVAAVAGAVDVPVQAGGGVRSREAAQALFDAGVTRVVVGTAAVEQPDLVAELAQDRRVAVGLDVRGTEVAVRGWEQGSGRHLAELAAAFEGVGVEVLVVTEISVDGTFAGPALATYEALLAEVALPVVASGGVGSLDDLRTLASVRVGDRRLAGAVVGRALYEGRVDVAAAVAVLRGGSEGR